MEFKHIEYFISACRYTSISAAAETLFISQQALSHSIHLLEKDLGVKLLNRTSKGISLTEEGQYFYHQFAPLLQQYRNTVDKTISHFDQLPRTVSLASAVLSPGVLDPQAMIDFRSAHPNITVFRQDMPDKMVDDYVRECDSHFAIMAVPETQHGKVFDFIPMRTVPLMLYLHKDHPLARRESVTFSMLKDEQFLAFDQLSHYHDLLKWKSEQFSFHPNIVFETFNISDILWLINRGTGIFIDAERPKDALTYSNVISIPFADPEMTYCVAFIFQDFEKLDGASKQFIQYMVRYFNPESSEPPQNQSEYLS